MRLRFPQPGPGSVGGCIVLGVLVGNTFGLAWVLPAGIIGMMLGDLLDQFLTTH